MNIINAAIVYFDKDDLFEESQDKPIEDIKIADFKYPKVIRGAEIVILKIGEDYRVIKSRI